MEPQASGAQRSLALALSFFALITALAPPKAEAQNEFFVTPVAEKTLQRLPAGPLYWTIETFPTTAEAQKAGGDTSLFATVSGKVWLFTLGPKEAPRGGTVVAEIGPTPPFAASEYRLRINHAGGPPGAMTPVHTHAGSEAFYVISGKLGQKTPHGVAYVDAGETMNGHGADMPMQLFSAGETDLDQLVMFVVDAARPFSSPATFD